MKTTVQKWGNSLGIRIPGHMAKELSLKSGSTVEIIEENNKLIIHARQNKLSEALELITEANLHEEQFNGIAGKEMI